MASIGYLNKLTSGVYEGKLQLMSLKTGVELKMLPNADKRDARHPDFRLTGNGVEIGAAWIKDSRSRPGETYISVVIAAPGLTGAQQEAARRTRGRGRTTPTSSP